MNKKIKELKELLMNDQVGVLDAVNDFISILNEHDNEFDVSDDYIILQHLSRFNYSVRLLLEDQKKVKNRITNLNSILVLLEFGVSFEEEELKNLLKKRDDSNS